MKNSGRIIAVLAAAAFAASAASAQGPSLTEDQKTLYALGVAMGRNVVGLLKPGEIKFVVQGLRDSAAKRPLLADPAQYNSQIQALLQGRMSAQSDQRKKAGSSYLAKALAEKGAVKLDNGAVYIPGKAGTGAHPKATDTVKVNYEGSLTDGTIFDSSYKRGTPAEFPLNGVVPCWTQGIQKLQVGGTGRLVCPSDTAYGDQGRPPVIPGGATLVFRVELLGITTK